VIFFYEFVFFGIAIVAILLGELVSRTLAVALVMALLAVVALGAWSFDARLATDNTVSAEDRRWFTDARDGLKHLRLLLALGALAALAWRLIAG
jgi:hypothetical protein